MPEQFETSTTRPRRGTGYRRRLPPDPYAVAVAEKCRANPGLWIRFAPNGQSFQAQHLATKVRDRICRGDAPWGDGLWEATTHKVNGRQDPETEEYAPAWEVWVSYAGPSPAVDDPDQPAFPIDRY